MSLPSTSSASKGIDGEKPGGTSPSPVEGVVGEVGIPGPSSLDRLGFELPQEDNCLESKDDENDADEDEEEEYVSSDAESEVI